MPRKSRKISRVRPKSPDGPVSMDQLDLLLGDAEPEPQPEQEKEEEPYAAHVPQISKEYEDSLYTRLHRLEEERALTIQENAILADRNKRLKSENEQLREAILELTEDRNRLKEIVETELVSDVEDYNINQDA